MPVSVDLPLPLRPYWFHGVPLRLGGSQGSEANGDCPFCDKEGKFYVSSDTSEFQCKSCTLKGNSITFLRELHAASLAATSDRDYQWLSTHRKLSVQTLREWGVCRSISTGDWLVPAYYPDVETARLGQLYKYVKDIESDKFDNSHEHPARYILKCTYGLPHQVFGLSLFNDDKPQLEICEGPWDGMARYEALRAFKMDYGDDEGFDNPTPTYTPTSNANASMYKDVNIICTPGCLVFYEGWAKLCDGKVVTVLYDNDYPKQNQGKVSEPASFQGVKNVARVLSVQGSEYAPKELRYLRWGDGGYDSSLKSGYDIRDILADKTSPKEVAEGLAFINSRIAPTPGEWVGTSKRGSIHIEPSPCKEWRVVEEAFGNAMHMTDGLKLGLACSIATVISTPVLGDQLWLKMIGPAGCGKTSLCDAVCVDRKHVKRAGIAKGFHSGYKSDEEGKEDNSLISKLYGMTLVTVDGDVLLQADNYEQILADGREIYDCNFSKSYRNKVNRDYEGLRMTWILCGTNSLRQMDTSELGERFLTVIIARDMHMGLKRLIANRVISKTETMMNIESNCRPESHYEPKMLEAMKLTGGYIYNLRRSSAKLFEGVSVSPKYKEDIVTLAIFVSYMRARPSPKQDEKVEPENPSRLTAQLYRLAKCLCVVLNKDSVDDEVMSKVKQVALDTADGRTLEIIRYLFGAGKAGIAGRKMGLYTNQPVAKEESYLDFLTKLGAVESFMKPGSTPGLHARRFRLARDVGEVIGEVLA